MGSTLQQAIDLLQAGRSAEADERCRRVLADDPANALAMHVRGLAHRQLGRLEEAERFLRASIALAPRNPEFQTNLAQLLAARGNVEESSAAFERALAIDPAFRPALIGFARFANRIGSFALAERHARTLIALGERDAQAWSALGVALHGLHNALAAREALQRAVALAPAYGAARHQLVAVLCDDEQSEQALMEIDEAMRMGVTHQGMMLTRARALMQLDRYAEAEAVLIAELAAVPFDVNSQFLLAQLRHVRGDAEFDKSFREVAVRHDAPVAIRAGHADLLRRMGRHADAAEALRRLLQQQGPLPSLLGSLATVLQAMGRHDEAVGYARSAAVAQPDDAISAENYVAALLSAGEPRQALPIIEQFQSRSADDQRWITYRADVARQCGDSLFDELCDFERLVRCYDVPAPRGFATIEEFHAVLRPALYGRHRQRLHPLDQSLRFGTQTSRGLLSTGDPIIEGLMAALMEPLAQYQAEIGFDPKHPLRRRNRSAARISGCWSVRLQRGGFHVNHIHPQGWISSAYYVSIPPEVSDESLRSGWIKFGEPLYPSPGAGPKRFVQPREARLVLFPSYLWHGTTPIHGDEPRLTVAFDAIPSAASGH